MGAREAEPHIPAWAFSFSRSLMLFPALVTGGMDGVLDTLLPNPRFHKSSKFPEAALVDNVGGKIGRDEDAEDEGESTPKALLEL